MDDEMSPLPLPPQLPTPDQLHIKGQYHMYDTLSEVKLHQPPPPKSLDLERLMEYGLLSLAVAHVKH